MPCDETFMILEVMKNQNMRYAMRGELMVKVVKNMSG